MSLDLEFVRVTDEKIIDFIRQSTQRLLFVKPAFFKWEIEEILNVKKFNFINQCEIYLENGDESIRFGFGDCDALELLQKNQDLLLVQLVDRVRLSILIVDNNCLIYSPNIAQLDDENFISDFPNGLYGNKNIVDKIISKFPTYTLETPTAPVVEEIKNPFEGINELVNLHSQSITEELSKTITYLEKNPPANPSSLKKINIYRNNYKILKRQLLGVKIKNKKINLNHFNKLLSTSNERLLSSWNIFTNEDIQKLQDMTYFGVELKKVDSEYNLLDIGRFGLLIESKVMLEYKENVNELKNEFIDFMSGTLKEENRFLNYTNNENDNENEKTLNDVLNSSKEALVNYLLKLATAEKDFENIIIKENPTFKILFKNNNIKKEELFKIFILDYVDSKLKFPYSEELIQKIDVKNDYYDVSDQILNDDDFNKYVNKYDLENIRKYTEGYEQIEFEYN